MDEVQLNDMILSVSSTVEKNHCAIKREQLFQKYKNTDPETLKYVVEVMKQRRMLIYDQKYDKYRLVL